MKYDQWYSRSVPAGKSYAEMTAAERKRALCSEANGDISKCRVCRMPCMIGRRLTGTQEAKHYTTVGVPAQAEPVRRRPTEPTANQDAVKFPSKRTNPWNEQRKRETDERVQTAIARIKAGVDREQAARDAGYSRFGALYEAALARGLNKELPRVDAGKRKREEADRRALGCCEDMIGGMPPADCAKKYGLSSIDAMLHLIRSRKEVIDSAGYGDYMFTKHGPKKRETSCSRNTESPQNT